MSQTRNKQGWAVTHHALPHLETADAGGSWELKGIDALRCKGHFKGCKRDKVCHMCTCWCWELIKNELVIIKGQFLFIYLLYVLFKSPVLIILTMSTIKKGSVFTLLGIAVCICSISGLGQEIRPEKDCASQTISSLVFYILSGIKIFSGLSLSGLYVRINAAIDQWCWCLLLDNWI